MINPKIRILCKHCNQYYSDLQEHNIFCHDAQPQKEQQFPKKPILQSQQIQRPQTTEILQNIPFQKKTNILQKQQPLLKRQYPQCQQQEQDPQQNPLQQGPQQNQQQHQLQQFIQNEFPQKLQPKQYKCVKQQQNQDLKDLNGCMQQIQKPHNLNKNKQKQQQQQQQQQQQKQQQLQLPEYTCCDNCGEIQQFRSYNEFRQYTLERAERESKLMPCIGPIIEPQRVPQIQFANYRQFSSPQNKRITTQQSTNQALMQKKQQDLNVDKMTDEEVYEYFTQLDILNMKGYSLQQLQSSLNSSQSLKDSDQDCMICIQKLKKGELLTILECVHCFHNECITQWLLVQKSCPICKIQVNVI